MEENVIKLTNALYGILDFLPDSDPLKNRCKEKALSILENLTLVAGSDGWISLQKEKAKAQLLDDIEVLENYLKIGKSLGWIDNINFLIVTKEYQGIKESITPPAGIIRQSLEMTQRPIKAEPLLIDNDQKPNISSIKPINSGEYSERQVKILQILETKEKAQVADFIKEIPDITKRTVRRDLDDLLKRGKVIRVGEWNQVFYQIQHQI